MAKIIPPDLTSPKTLNIFKSRIRKNDISSMIDDGCRGVLSAHHNHLIWQFSLSYFRLQLECNILYVVSIFLFVYCIGNFNYFIITCVPKLVCGCSQAIRLRHINEGFYSILYTVIDICLDLLKRGYRNFKCILTSWHLSRTQGS